MEKIFKFTTSEVREILRITRNIREKVGNALSPDDENNLRQFIKSEIDAKKSTAMCSG